jgi:hypothetical protein
MTQNDLGIAQASLERLLWVEERTLSLPKISSGLALTRQCITLGLHVGPR